jgi:hypothetical protein
VDRYLPEANGQFTCANYGANLDGTFKIFGITVPGNNVLWVALAEKAYAQLAEEGWSRAYAGQTANSYASLNYGQDVPTLEQITGSLQTSSYSVGYSGATKSQLIQDVNAGHPLVAWTTQSANAYGAIANHVYAVTGYDSATNTFTLLNPYADGDTYPPDGPRVIQLTWQQFKQEFGGWDTIVP